MTGISGPVRVVKDTMNAIEHALKSVHLSEFKENEIRCWIDQNNDGYIPKLFTCMFQVQNGQVLLRMEILKDIMTLRCLIIIRGVQYLSLVLRKLVFGHYDQVAHKPGCTSTEDG